MKKISKNFLLTTALLVIVTGIICVLAVTNYFFREKNVILENEISQNASSTAAMVEKYVADRRSLENTIKTKEDQITQLDTTINQIEADLKMTAVERDNFEKKYAREKNRMNEFNSQIDDILGSVDTLQQLEATDDELLMKYSKVYFLNENYIPESLAKIDPEYTFNPQEEYLFYAKIEPFLDDMLASAKDDSINLEVISAYRSFAQQSSIKSTYSMIYGSGANQFSADQGYSEHQLGTTVNLTTSAIGSSFTGFDQSPAYKWLVDNAYKYGFILSYPKNNSYYQYEPWHWRFVGRDLARTLHDDNKNFYDLDQREIDKYQISFFD